MNKQSLLLVFLTTFSSIILLAPPKRDPQALAGHTIFRLPANILWFFSKFIKTNITQPNQDSQMSKRQTFRDLPIELLEVIAKFLEFNECKDFRLVSKQSNYSACKTLNRRAVRKKAQPEIPNFPEKHNLFGVFKTPSDEDNFLLIERKEHDRGFLRSTWDQFLSVIDTTNQTLLRTIDNQKPNSKTKIFISKDGSLLAIYCPSGISFYDSREQKDLEWFWVSGEDPDSLAFSQDLRTVIVASFKDYKTHLYFFDLTPLAPISQTLEPGSRMTAEIEFPYQERIAKLCLSHCGKNLAILETGQVIHFLDIDSKSITRSIDIHRDNFLYRDFTFSVDDTKLIALSAIYNSSGWATDESVITVFDIESGQQEKIIKIPGVIIFFESQEDGSICIVTEDGQTWTVNIDPGLTSEF